MLCFAKSPAEVLVEHVALKRVLRTLLEAIDEDDMMAGSFPGCYYNGELKDLLDEACALVGRVPQHPRF